MKFLSIKEKEKKVFGAMKDAFKYKNPLAAPHLLKVVISSATGSGLKRDRNRNEIVSDRLTKITGQKPIARKSKKSISGFKLRQGEEIGFLVTLRGARMYGFVDKFLNVALPRTKDYRGVPRTVVDSVGNLTVGVKEHTIFPETGDEELKDVFGMGVTFVTSAKTREEAIKFFECIGVPFRKQ